MGRAGPAQRRLSRRAVGHQGQLFLEAAAPSFNWPRRQRLFLAAMVSGLLLRQRQLQLMKIFCENAGAHAACDDCDLLHAGAGLRDAVFRTGRGAGPGVYANGMVISVFRHAPGWLGVALTGSDTSANALFGSLQRITAQQLGIDPILMCAANSAGGVMGKMVDAQSITIARRLPNRWETKESFSGLWRGTRWRCAPSSESSYCSMRMCSGPRYRMAIS